MKVKGNSNKSLSKDINPMSCRYSEEGLDRGCLLPSHALLEKSKLDKCIPFNTGPIICLV